MDSVYGWQIFKCCLSYLYIHHTAQLQFTFEELPVTKRGKGMVPKVSEGYARYMVCRIAHNSLGAGGVDNNIMCTRTHNTSPRNTYINY